jgi:hypothetical protein
MAIDSVDYSKKLARANANHRDQMKSLKDSFEKDISSVKKTADQTKTGQSEAYEQDRLKSEASTVKAFERVKNNTDDQLFEKAEAYRQRLSNLENDFQNSREKDFTKFQNKLENLNSEYDNTKKLQDIGSRKREENIVDNFSGRIKAMDDNHAYEKEKARENFAFENQKYRGKMENDQRLLENKISQKKDVLHIGAKDNRGDFSNELAKIRKSSNDEKLAMDRDNSLQRQRQKYSYDQDRQDLEFQNANSMDQLKKNTEVALKEKSKVYNNRIEQLGQQSNALRLEDIDRNNKQEEMMKTSLTQALENERVNNSLLQDQKNAEFKDKSFNQSKNQNETINGLVKSTQDSVNKIQKLEKLDRQNLAKLKEDQISDLRRDVATERMQTAQRNQKNLGLMQDTYQREANSLKALKDNNKEGLKDYFDVQQQQVYETYQDKVKDMTDRNSIEKKKIVYDNQTNVANLQGQQVAEKAELKEVIGKMSENNPNASNSRAGFERKRVEESFNNKIKNANDYLDQFKMNAEDSKRVAQESYRETIEGKQANYIKGNTEKDKEINDLVLDQKFKMVKERDDLIGSVRANERNLTLSYEDQLSRQNIKSKEKLENLLATNQDNMLQIQEKSQEAITKTQDMVREQKKDFIRKSNFERNEEMRQAREDFDRSMMLREKAAESRTQEISQAKTSEEKRYINKFQTLEKKSLKELQRMQTAMQEKEVSDRREFQQVLFQQKTMFAQEMENLSRSFQNKLRDDRQEHAVKLTRLIEAQKEQMEITKNEFEAEIRRRQTMADELYNRLALSTQMERETMRTQYEDRMEQLKFQHAQDLARKTSANKSIG